MKCPKCDNLMVIIFGDDNPETHEEVGLEIHQCDNCGFQQIIEARKVKKPIKGLFNHLKRLLLGK